MGRADFQARLKRLAKVPSAGAKRAVNKAMLHDKINDVRSRRDDQRPADDDAGSSTAWLSVFLLICFMVLGTLFVHDPEDAKRKAIVMVPLMVLLLVIIAVRDFRRSRLEFLQWNLWVDLDMILKLIRFLR